VAIGRKNWLFAGNDAAGASHARLWTLIASTERHGLDPQAYLRSVPAKVGSTPLGELGQFLPDRWKAEDASQSASISMGTPADTSLAKSD
jgi:transposase